MAFQKTGDWELWLRLLTSARFKSKLMTEIRRAMVANAEAVRGAIIKRIDSKAFAPNAPFTVALKGSSTPLVDKGDLRRSIRSKIISWKEAFVGVLRSGGGANVAELLHEGGAIKVTPKMRAWFAWKASELGMKPLAPSTTTIKISGRPFIRVVIENPIFEFVMIENFSRAVEAALNDTVASFVTSL